MSMTYEDLLYYYKERGYKIDELKEQLRKVEDKLYSSEWKVKYELEPRIESEKRSYDNWVSDPSSHSECASNGMAGRCGFECTCFGDEIECFENITDEQLLYCYAEIRQDGLILDYIHDRELDEEKNKIDIEYLENQIKRYKENIETCEAEINKIKVVDILNRRTTNG